MYNRQRLRLVRLKLWLKCLSCAVANLAIIAVVASFIDDALMRLDCNLLALLCASGVFLTSYLSHREWSTQAYQQAEASAQQFPCVYRQVRGYLDELLQRSGRHGVVYLVLHKSAPGASILQMFWIGVSLLEICAEDARRQKRSLLRMTIAHELCHRNRYAPVRYTLQMVWKFLLILVVAFGLLVVVEMYRTGLEQAVSVFREWCCVVGAYTIGRYAAELCILMASRAQEHLCDIGALEIVDSLPQAIAWVNSMQQDSARDFARRFYQTERYRPNNWLLRQLKKVVDSWFRLRSRLFATHPLLSERRKLLEDLAL